MGRRNIEGEQKPVCYNKKGGESWKKTKETNVKITSGKARKSR